MARLLYCIKDADGFCAVSGSVERSGWSKDQLIAHVAATMPRGSSVIDLDKYERPPSKPDTSGQKVDRLAELRAIGWDKRTEQENVELDGLARDLG